MAGGAGSAGTGSRKAKKRLLTHDAGDKSHSGQSGSGGEDRRPQPPPSPPVPASSSLLDETTGEDKCVICISSIVNKCKTNGCNHEFCYSCLVEWTKEKAECPLCKTKITKIRHNMRSEGGVDKFDEYIVPPPRENILDFFDLFRAVEQRRQGAAETAGAEQARITYRWFNQLELLDFDIFGGGRGPQNRGRPGNGNGAAAGDQEVPSSQPQPSTSTRSRSTITFNWITGHVPALQAAATSPSGDVGNLAATTRTSRTTSTSATTTTPMATAVLTPISSDSDSEDEGDYGDLFSFLAEPPTTLPARPHSDFGLGNNTIVVEDDETQDNSPPPAPAVGIRLASLANRGLVGYQNRRRIYDREQYAIPLPAPRGIAREGSRVTSTVTYFNSNPGEMGRIKPWLKRELRVLLRLTNDAFMVKIVYDRIKELVMIYDVSSRELCDIIRPYFESGARVRHFQHEFFQFVGSGMSMEEYDRTVTYSGGRSGESGSGPPAHLGDDGHEDGHGRGAGGARRPQNTSRPDIEVITIDDDDNNDNETRPSTSARARAAAAAARRRTPGGTGNIFDFGHRGPLHRSTVPPTAPPPPLLRAVRLPQRPQPHLETVTEAADSDDLNSSSSAEQQERIQKEEENEDDCEYVGVFPIERPPPLAVITLDEEDEEDRDHENVDVDMKDDVEVESNAGTSSSSSSSSS